MLAAYIDRTGSIQNINVSELAEPSLGDNSILVSVEAVAVNMIDCYIRSGQFPQPLSYPFILGRDACGTVLAVGENVKKFQPGQRVWTNCQGFDGQQGVAAERIVVDQARLFLLPDATEPLSAVAVFHSAFTAIIGLTREAKLKAGQTIYIHGAAGNVGSALIQIAKSKGAVVIASTHGDKKMKYCYELGADTVIDYKQDFTSELYKIAPNGVDVIWNTGLTHPFETLLPLLAMKGCYILMSGLGTTAALPVGELYTRDASIRGFAISHASLAEYQQAAITINQLLANNKLETKIAKIFPLSEMASAHAMMEQGGIWGKIVIQLQQVV